MVICINKYPLWSKCHPKNTPVLIYDNFEDDNSILFFVKRMNESYRFYKKMLDNFDKEYLRANAPVNDAPDGA